MRTGRLLIEEKKSLEFGDAYFDTKTHEQVFVDNIILSDPPPLSECVDLFIEDTSTKEKFPLFYYDQKKYLLWQKPTEPVKFYILPGTERVIVVVCKSKELFLQADRVSQLADEYGAYVALQKEQKRGAKSFMEWLHEISV